MPDKKIRYAVVGMGHIAQIAVLPAFAHAAKNSELTAVFSDDAEKRRELTREYGVPSYDYADYDALLKRREFDAVYIALPNNLHADYTIRALKAGIHVLCEKPLAVTTRECEAMIRTARKNKLRLMTAYRLHFEAANMKTVQLAHSGKLGDLRLFSSVFTMQIRPENIRLENELGGGTLYDIGVYCINAARYLFRDEPEEVFAYSVKGTDKRFSEVDEMTSAVLRFPKNRLASFTCSFAAAAIAHYRLVGTRGDICMEPAYEYAERLHRWVTVGEKTRERLFRHKDQFAPELLYFSNCILDKKEPEPSGLEGLADVRVIEALYRSAHTGKPVKIKITPSMRYPTARQIKNKPRVKKPRLVKVKSAHR